MSKNETAAQEYIAEARQMAPDMDAYEQDLLDFARVNGIFAESMDADQRVADDAVQS